MTHASIPDFSVPLASRSARAVTVAVEHLTLAAPLGRLPGSSTVITIPAKKMPPPSAEPRFALAGDALAAFVLIVVGGLLIGWAALL